jgi:hypothetical protein
MHSACTSPILTCSCGPSPAAAAAAVESVLTHTVASTVLLPARMSTAPGARWARTPVSNVYCCPATSALALTHSASCAVEVGGA